MKIFNLIFVLFLTGCMSASPQEDCNFFKNVFNERVSWKNKVPVVFYIDKSVPQEYIASIVYAANVWNKAIGKKIIKISDEYPVMGSVSHFDSQNVIYYYREFWPETDNTQGMTKIRARGDLLLDTDIILNGENFSYYTLNDPDSLDKVNLETLMIHEFGHALGLKHSDNFSDTMYPSLALGQERIYVDEYALKSLKCEY